MKISSTVFNQVVEPAGRTGAPPEHHLLEIRSGFTSAGHRHDQREIMAPPLTSDHGPR